MLCNRIPLPGRADITSLSTLEIYVKIAIGEEMDYDTNIWPNLIRVRDPENTFICRAGKCQLKSVLTEIMQENEQTNKENVNKFTLMPTKEYENGTIPHVNVTKTYETKKLKPTTTQRVTHDAVTKTFKTVKLTMTQEPTLEEKTVPFLYDDVTKTYKTVKLTTAQESTLEEKTVPIPHDIVTKTYETMKLKTTQRLTYGEDTVTKGYETTQELVELSSSHKIIYIACLSISFALNLCMVILIIILIKKTNIHCYQGVRNPSNEMELHQMERN